MIRFKEAVSEKLFMKVKDTFAKLISKKTGAQIGISPIPMRNDVGETIFMGAIEDKGISFNMLGGKLESISLYKDYDSIESSYRIELNGYNIVKVAQEIIDIIDEFLSSGKIDTTLNEGRRKVKDDVFLAWVDYSPRNLEYLRDERLSKVYNNRFSPWAEEQRVTMSISSFIKFAKEYLANEGYENKYARKVTVFNSKNKVIEVPDKSDDDLKYRKAISNSFDSVYAVVDQAFDVLLKFGYINALYIFGSPGVGKGTRVYSNLKKYNTKFMKVSGAIKSTKEFAHILFKNRKNKRILVCDDFDSALKKSGVRELLLAATDSSDKRFVTYVDNKEYDKFFALSNKFPDLNDEELEDKCEENNIIPPKFLFKGKVVIISNNVRLDKALADRALPIEVFFNKDEILKEIQNQIKDIQDDFPIAMKQEVLEFMIDNVNDIREVSFRTFTQGCIFKFMELSNSKVDWRTKFMDYYSKDAKLQLK